MKLVPKKNITFRTKLSEEEIKIRLKKIIEPLKFTRVKLFSFRGSDKYEGTFTDNQFKIHRIIHYRNSFLPRISGTIETNNFERSIHMKMRLQFSVILFFVFFVLAGIAMSIIGPAYLNESNSIMQFIFPLIALPIFYVAATWFFNYEAEKSINQFQQLLEAEIYQE